jgi:hypothetical protein
MTETANGESRTETINGKIRNETAEGHGWSSRNVNPAQSMC